MDYFSLIEQAANEAATGFNDRPHPTEAQAKAGNYRLGRFSYKGMKIAIENVRNSVREGVSPDGTPWQNRMAAHYGFFQNTIGADGDGIDVFVGAWPESDKVWVINQRLGGSFDEHKVMLCFQTEAQAKSGYIHSYDRGWKGLGSIVGCTIEQLRWWLKYGNHKIELKPEHLPFDGNNEMTTTPAWDSSTDIAAVMYSLRHDDIEGLLFDSVTVQDVLEDSDGEMVMDALVVPLNKLQRKMEQMQMVMNAAGGTVKPVALTVTPPFKQKGTTNVAAIYELSDGQSVSVFFHNPDSTPNKLTPDDEMVSWKWLLNKKDVTIVVAPEQGRDLNPREVARRIMRLAEKNSARFQQANAKRGERLATIESLKSGMEAKEATLSALDAEISDLETRAEAKRNEPAPSPAILQEGQPAENQPANQETASEQNLNQEQVESIVKDSLVSNGWTLDNGAALALKQYKTLSGLPAIAWLSRKDDGYNRSLSAQFDSEGHNVLSTSGVLIPIDAKPSEIASLVATFSNNVDKAVRDSLSYRVENSDPTTPERYAEIMKDSTAQIRYQDQLDSFFQGRLATVRNALKGLDWFGTEMVFSKSGSPYEFTYDVASVGAGANVVGIKYQLKDDKGVITYNLEDDLTKTPDDIAAEIDAAAAPTEQDAGDIVDAAYKFKTATKSFKEGVAQSVALDDYSAFLSAKAIDEAVLAKGGNTAWDWDDGSAIGTIFKDGEIIGRADIGGADGKSIILIGLTGDKRADFRSGYAAFRTDDAETLNEYVESLFNYVEPIKEGEGQLLTEEEVRAAAQGTEDQSADISYLQSIIGGTADMFAEDIADRLEKIGTDYAGDESMMDLFNAAANAYSDFMIAEARKALA